MSASDLVSGEIKHTALPWYLGQHAMGGVGASVVATIDCIAITAYGAFATPEEDAEFIVRACNAHADLVKALQETRAAFVIAVGDKSPFSKIVLEKIDAALAKAAK